MALAPVDGLRASVGWRLLFEDHPQPMWIVDRETLAFLAINEAAVALYGYSREEFLRMTVADVCPPEGGPALAPLDGLARHRRKDGSVITVSLLQAALDFEGRPACLGAPRDIAAAVAALQESEDRYRDLVEHSQDLICTHDLDGILLSVNPWAARRLGYEQGALLGMNMRDFLAPSRRPGFDQYITAIRTEGAAQGMVLVQTRGGEELIWEYRNTLRTEGVPAPVVRGMARDVTESKRAERALRLEKQRAQQYLDIAGVVLIAIGVDQTVTMINRTGCDLLGYEEDELLGQNWFDLCVPEDRRDAARAGFLRLLRGEVGPLEYSENPALTKHGECRPVAWRTSVLRAEDGRVIGTLSSGEDITARTQAELDRNRLLEEVQRDREQFEALSRRLVVLQEEERGAIARELHDQIGQLLTGLKLLAEAGRGKGDLLEVLSELMGRVRGLSLDLRPPMLDTVGLVPTLIWHFDRYTTQTGVRVEFRELGRRRRYSSDTEIAAFRIVQEALTNVARHAGVRDASVRLEAGDERLRMEVEDRGSGIGLASAPTAATLGITGMQERASLLGGRVSIDSRPGSGTRVEAELPATDRAEGHKP